MAKPKSKAQLDRAADLRITKVYGRGLDWYNSQFEKQGGGCAVCGDGPKTRRLHIDHDHKFKYTKIEYRKTVFSGTWVGEATYNGELYVESGKTKSEVKKKIYDRLKPASVRTLLCHRCNRAMILFKDHPEILRKAAEYLEKFQTGSPLSGREAT